MTALDPSDWSRDLLESDRRYFLQDSRSAFLELAPGDVVLFHSMLPHRSGPNRGTRSRRGLFLTYFPSRYRGISERYEQGRVDRPK